jgi:hypothetical protein
LGLTEYYVLIDASAFDDIAGNSYAGISSTTALSFTTVAVSSGGAGRGSPAVPQAAPVNNQPPTSSRELSFINTNIRVNLPSSFSGRTVKIYNNQKDKTVFVGSGGLNRFGNITITPNQPIKPGSLFATVGGNIVKVITIN